MIVSALQMRWKRALRIGDADVRRVARSQYWVRSQSGHDAGYLVKVGFDRDGRLTKASCTCPDFTKQVHPLATPRLRDVRVCKHILAAARVAKQERA